VIVVGDQPRVEMAEDAVAERRTMAYPRRRLANPLSGYFGSIPGSSAGSRKIVALGLLIRILNERFTGETWGSKALCRSRSKSEFSLSSTSGMGSAASLQRIQMSSEYEATPMCYSASRAALIDGPVTRVNSCHMRVEITASAPPLRSWPDYRIRAHSRSPTHGVFIPMLNGLPTPDAPNLRAAHNP
jgi:hypothetical protein